MCCKRIIRLSFSAYFCHSLSHTIITTSSHTPLLSKREPCFSLYLLFFSSFYLTHTSIAFSYTLFPHNTLRRAPPVAQHSIQNIYNNYNSVVI